MSWVLYNHFIRSWTTWALYFGFWLVPTLILLILRLDRGWLEITLTSCVIFSFALLLYVRVWADTRRNRQLVADYLLTIKQRLIEKPNDRHSIYQLRASLESTYIFEHFYALYTLGDLYEILGDQQVSWLYDLLKQCTIALGSDDLFVRNAAAQTLSRVGAMASVAINELAYTLQSYPHEGAGMYSAIALGNIDMETPMVLQALRAVENIPQALAYPEAHKVYMRFTRSDLDHGMNRSF